MSRRPSAALSAGLVAVKGAASPMPDMPSRTMEASNLPGQLSGRKGVGYEAPLNFRVSESFRREFKVYAARHGLKLNELLRLSFEAYSRENA